MATSISVRRRELDGLPTRRRGSPRILGEGRSDYGPPAQNPGRGRATAEKCRSGRGVEASRWLVQSIRDKTSRSSKRSSSRRGYMPRAFAISRPQTVEGDSSSNAGVFGFLGPRFEAWARGSEVGPFRRVTRSNRRPGFHPMIVFGSSFLGEVVLPPAPATRSVHSPTAPARIRSVLAIGGERIVRAHGRRCRAARTGGQSGDKPVSAAAKRLSWPGGRAPRTSAELGQIRGLEQPTDATSTVRTAPRAARVRAGWKRPRSIRGRSPSAERHPGRIPAVASAKLRVSSSAERSLSSRDEAHRASRRSTVTDLVHKIGRPGFRGRPHFDKRIEQNPVGRPRSVRANSSPFECVRLEGVPGVDEITTELAARSFAHSRSAADDCRGGRASGQGAEAVARPWALRARSVRRGTCRRSAGTVTGLSSMKTRGASTRGR